MASLIYGDVWLGDLDPTVGHEQAGERPILILSIDSFNRSRAGLVVILPITARLRGIPEASPRHPRGIPEACPGVAAGRGPDAPERHPL